MISQCLWQNMMDECTNGRICCHEIMIFVYVLWKLCFLPFKCVLECAHRKIFVSMNNEWFFRNGWSREDLWCNLDYMQSSNCYCEFFLIVKSA